MSTADDLYPNDDVLNALEQWPSTDCDGALRFMASQWITEYGTVRDTLTDAERELVGDETCLRFATGGWSGNEELVTALQTNALVWAFTWRLSACGGSHIFATGVTDDPR